MSCARGFRSRAGRSSATYAEIERLNALIREMEGDARLATSSLRRTRARPVNRVALVSSEPIRPRMGGIGVRYLEMARYRLPRGHRRGRSSRRRRSKRRAAAAGARCAIVSSRSPRLARRPGSATSDAIVAQGQLANDVAARRARPRRWPSISTIRGWSRTSTTSKALGLDPYRNDHATWVLQLSRGDFFLCSSEEQRLFYLGFLTALGRVNPERVARRSRPRSARRRGAVRRARRAAAARPLPAAARGRASGGSSSAALYDWYDPWTLLDALERLERARPGACSSSAIPNPASTPQTPLCARSRRAAGAARLVGKPGARRSTGCRPSVASTCCATSTCWSRRTGRASRPTLSLRTRFLDALAAGCPVVDQRGRRSARARSSERGAGWVVPPGDAAGARGRASRRRSRSGAAVERASARGRALAREFALGRALRAARRLPASARAGRDQGALRLRPDDRRAGRPARLPAAAPARRRSACEAARDAGGRARSLSVLILSLERARASRDLPRGARRAGTIPASPWEILVLDNGSSDGTAAWLRGARTRAVRLVESARQPRLLRRQQPAGRARRRRRGGAAQQRHPARAATGSRRSSTPGARRRPTSPRSPAGSSTGRASGSTSAAAC